MTMSPERTNSTNNATKETDPTVTTASERRTAYLDGVFDLSGRRAVVTGASQGIGLAIVEALARAGADIIAVSRHLPTGDSPARRVVEAAGVGFTPVRCDFADRAAVETLAERVRTEPVDILVNNGGTVVRIPAVEHPDREFDRVLDINLRSAFVLTKAAGAGMLAKGRGWVINTASMLSFQGGINIPGYTASKSALAGLTKAFANEWAARGVNVNAVAPGYIATSNTKALQEDPRRSAEILARIPAGRWGRPEDIAGAVLFLCSRAADYVHGAILPVDGGWLAR